MVRDMPKEILFDRAKQQAIYAINSESKVLVYQAYGHACGLYEAGGITMDEFMELNTLLVRDTMNNARKWSTFHTY